MFIDEKWTNHNSSKFKTKVYFRISSWYQAMKIDLSIIEGNKRSTKHLFTWFHLKLIAHSSYRLIYILNLQPSYGAGSAYPNVAPEITPSFWWGSCCLFFSFLCFVMCTIVCLFVFFIFSHGVFSLFSIYEFDCPSGVFRPSFTMRRLWIEGIIWLKPNIHITTDFYNIPII